MSAKQLLPSQCDILHQYWPVNECCLCKANERIVELEKQVAELRDKEQIAVEEPSG